MPPAPSPKREGEARLMGFVVTGFFPADGLLLPPNWGDRGGQTTFFCPPTPRIGGLSSVGFNMDFHGKI